MKNKLLIRVGIITSLFLAAVLLASETVLFTSARNIFLTAKNDTFARDLNVICSEIREVSSITAFMDYWNTNRETMKAGVSEEEYEEFERIQNENGFEWFTNEMSDDKLNSFPPYYIHILANDYLYYIYSLMRNTSSRYGYDRFILLDVGESSDGCVITQGSKEDNTDADASDDSDTYYTELRKVYERIGTKPVFDAAHTKAAEKIRGGQAGDIAYEVVNGDDGVPYYAGYILITSKDEHRYAMCILYNWSGFREKMNGAVFPSILISALLIVAANILLIRFLYLQSVRPVTQIQKNVRDYTATKDSERVIGELAKIKEKNEFGELASDVSHLAREIDRYTAEIAQLAGEKERAAAELELASHIQASALPSSFPAFPDRKDFDIFASMDPAKEVGGDFYDFFLIDDDHLALVIADVSGKGVPAALFMMMSKILIYDKAVMGGTPADIIEFVNSRLCPANKDDMFVTVWLGIVELSTGRMTCCNAGHEYPAIKKANGSFALLKDKHGPVVGAMPGIHYKDYELMLEKGDTVFVYTDGVPEATNSTPELFGNERMTDALNAAGEVGLQELLSSVRHTVDVFVGSAPQFDDLTMLAFRYFGK